MLKLNKIKEYKYVFLSSSAYWEGKYKNSYLKFLGFVPKSRNGVLIVEHNLSYIDKYNEKKYLKQDRLFTLSGFQNTKMLNPHYFGEVKITPKSGDKTRFIVVGGINKNNKNHDLLIKTAQKLAEHNTNFEITVIGLSGSINIPEELKDIIHYKGKLPFNKMYKEMEKADFFLPL